MLSIIWLFQSKILYFSFDGTVLMQKIPL